MELSIDTSTRYAAVGLSRQGQTFVELCWRSEQNHSVELVPAILEVMRRARVSMGQLEAIFVAKGPGAFSALRVGMSTAKAMAVALGVPLVGVGTLDIEAAPYFGLGHTVYAVIQAGQDRVYVGRYPANEHPLEPDYQVLGHEALAAEVGAPTLFCGEGARALEDMLRERLQERAIVARARPPTRRPGFLAQLGYQWLQMGATDNPDTLQPLYLRSSQVSEAQRRPMQG